ncbi:MAG: addiction module protein [Gammaproteobacteria bacterium]|nr:addiction module protein [Gammaproteobacteria bacterium]
MNTQTLIDEITSLPVEERVLVADCLLKSITPTESAIDHEWSELAKKRLADIRLGNAEIIEGKEVFDKIWSRLNK